MFCEQNILFAQIAFQTSTPKPTRAITH